MVNFSVQDRARVLLAREQQTAAAAAHAAAAHRQQTLSSQQAVAFLGGAASHGYAPTAPPHFQHIGGPASATAALLNSSAALMGHSGMAQVQSANPVQQAPRPQPVNPDQRNSLVTKSEQSSKKDARSSKESKLDQASRKDQALRKDQKKANVKRENAPKKDGSAVQTTSSGNVEVPASRKRKMSDQERIEAQAQKRRMSSDKSTQAKSSDQKRTEATPSVTKSVQGAPGVVSSSIRQDVQVAATSHKIADKIKDPSRNDSKKKESDADAPSQPKVTSENLLLSKDSSSASSAQSSKAPAQLQKSIIPSESTADVHMEDAASSSPQGTGGMQFFVPPAPPGVSAEVASLVLAARNYEAIEFMENSENPTNAASLVDYLIAVGTAVPIPKALVANPFKDRMNAPVLKNNNLGSIPAQSREVSTKQKDARTDR
jgi:hypothetical protein